jgi:shikimate kinase
VTRPTVVLIGTMGAGKTTVGRLVADALDVDFLDTDLVIEGATGKAVADIFIEDGEGQFRIIEAKTVKSALREHSGVLALGGGAAMNPETRQDLKGHRVVFLRVGLPEASARVGLGVSRPMLIGNIRSQIKKLMDERNPVYESVATDIVETDGVSAALVAQQIVDLVQDGGHA